MIVYKIKVDYECYNHCVMRGDVTICGEDIAGDSDRVIKEIKGKITCPRCIDLIRYCHGINLIKDVKF